MVATVYRPETRVADGSILSPAWLVCGGLALLLHVVAAHGLGAARDSRPQRLDPVRPVEFAVLAAQPAKVPESAPAPPVAARVFGPPVAAHVSGPPVAARVAEPPLPSRPATVWVDQAAAEPVPAPLAWVQPNPAGAPAQAPAPARTLAPPEPAAVAPAVTAAVAPALSAAVAPPVGAAVAPPVAAGSVLAPVAAVAAPATVRAAPEPAGAGEPQRVASVAYLHAPPPPYPPRARRLGIEGTARIVVLIGEDGAVRESRLARSSGDHDLDRAALEAVRGWRFVPAQRGERAVPAYAEIPVTFRLTDAP
jgi:protein TonB